MPTLTINGGVLIGTPQVQPAQGSIQLITRTIAGGSLPALDTPISVPRMILNVNLPTTPVTTIQSIIKTVGASDHTVVANPNVNVNSILSGPIRTIQSIIKAVGASDHIIANPAKINVITPSYALSLEPGSYDASRFDPTIFTTKRFEPYEQLTGISQERPEIIMMTNFLPLFKNDTNKVQQTIDAIEDSGFYPFMTPAGRYVDAQLQSRNLKSLNTVKMLTRMRDNYTDINATFLNRQQSFGSTVDALTDTTSFLLTLIKGMNKLKEQLDMRDDLYDVDPQAVAQAQALSNAAIATLSAIGSRLSKIKRFIPATYTLVDALTTLGFDKNIVKSVFSSTKIWLQMMLDMKIIVQSHSLEFVDTDPTSRRNDDNAASILRDSIKRFGLSQNILVPELAGITNVPVIDVSNVTNLVNQGFQKIYEDAALKSDDIKIAALINLISKEFNYSSGLAKQPVQRALIDGFGFKVAQNDNRTLFDAVIGQVGTSISDVPATETNSLASVAQRQLTNDEIVLTFESKYVAGDTGTLTPGSKFFIDSVLKTDGTKFDTSRLDELAFQLQGSYDRFNTIISGMNLLSQGASVSSDNMDFRLILSSQPDFFHYLLSQLVNVSTGETLSQVKNDSLSSVYSQAQKSDRVKAILFVYTMCRITRSYRFNIPALNANPQSDNTPTTDALIELLLTTLQESVSESRSTLTIDQTATTLTAISAIAGIVSGTPMTSKLNIDAIRTSMKKGSAVTNIIETTMSKVLGAFRADDGAIVDGKTRFGGDIDTTIMMVVFDLLITMIARLNNQSIVSFSPASATTVNSFIVTKTSNNHSETIRDLTTRLDKEIALIQKLTYATLNVLKNLATSVQSFSSYLNNPSSIQKLRDIASVFSDPSMLQMLFSEQQIMVLASTVYDLKANLSKRINGSDDEFLLLDNSNVTPKLQHALYGLLGNNEFTLANGFNKKVLTVGVPVGFSKHLQQSVKLNNLKKTSFVNKQNDIVSVVVYKTDLKNPDIVYKPQRFLFELSRFPTRGQQGYQDIPTHPTVDDIVNAIPTRDFGQSLKAGYDPVYGTIAGDPVTNGFKAAFDAETYSFLSDAQKAEIIRNHIVSYLMEVYVSLLTGINVADYHFDLVEPPPAVEPDFIKVLTDHWISHVVDLSSVAKNQIVQGNTTVTGRLGGILFSSTLSSTTPVVTGRLPSSNTFNLSNMSGIAGAVDTLKQYAALTPVQPIASLGTAKRLVEQSDSNLTAVSQRIVPSLIADMQLLSGFSRTISSLADVLALSKRLLQPKQFDRVFNVIVDPDNFQIDYDNTVKTPYGKQALEQMITNGDVIPEEQNNQIFRRVLVGKPSIAFSKTISLAGSTLYRDRDKTPDDLAFEKYFVTIETLDESEQN